MNEDYSDNESKHESPYADCGSVPDWANPGFFGDFTNECYSSEKSLIDNLVAENENINGVTCVYYRLSLDAKQDEFMGDDPTKHAIDSFRFMAMLPSPPSMNPKFSISSLLIDDTIDITSGIAHFMASQKNIKMPPMVGDAVQTLYNKAFWQIIYVDDMTPKTQPFGVKTVFSIKLKQWENSHHGTEFPITYSGVNPSLDDPMGDLAEYQKLAQTEALFKADSQLDALKNEGKTFYEPDLGELPPSNDKDNPFPKF